jgi:uncharacterized protein involved in exopolysaccharide biosynthesis
MKEPIIYRQSQRTGDEAISLLAVGSAVLRYRRVIIVLSLVGIAAALAVSLLGKKVYSASSTFIPEGANSGATSGLAAAAGQFGITLPSSGNGWGPPVYVELLRSRALLAPIAADTFLVPEEGRRVALMDLFDIEAPVPALRVERTVRVLRRKVTVTEDKKLGAVKLTVLTRWPSVSFEVANRLVSGVNQFNLESRKTQAGAERRFVEEQASGAESALREAENRLQTFLQRNRGVVSSPELTLEKERLQRDVTLRQQMYTSLTQSKAEARIREVRNTPVITVIEEPQLPVLAEPRNAAAKALLGGVAGAVLGVIIAFLAQGVAGARTAPTQEAREFFELVDEATPPFLRRG